MNMAEIIFTALLAHTPDVSTGQLIVDSTTRDFAHASGSTNCEIHMHPILNNFTPNVIAGILGHELAHCSLDHSGKLAQLAKAQQLDVTNVQRYTWQNEYEADMLGVAIAYDSGYDSKEALEQFLHTFQNDDATHPSGAMRIKALENFNDRSARTYNEIIKLPTKEAMDLSSVDGRIILR